MDNGTRKMLKELTEAHGVPGFEGEIRTLIKKYLAPITAIETDNIGSIICRKVGDADGPVIMIPGHMDEIGFMVRHITKEGFIKFAPLGGWFDQVLLSQRVVVKGKKGDVIGIIGSKPPHMLAPGERSKVISKDNMFIDVGASSDKEAERKYGVRVGDPIFPDAKFTEMKNPKLLMSKAWDDRVGCAMFMSAIQKLRRARHPNIVCGVGTVQEEVGIRGARTTKNIVNPDVCIVAESGIATDTPGFKPEDATCKLGKGPVIYLLDSGMIGHTKLRDLVMDTAKKSRIPFQVGVLLGGATDGREVHLHGRGVPTIFIGVPARYIHTHVGIIHTDDYDNTIKLLVAVIKKLDAKTVKKLKE
ncbi:MAG: M42 family metallopeptidase [Planctomycetes bacterium]|nr:M42 family metallopeptidase [Planctomycetota bacterium]